ncbi:bifunctional oligoribonuclease/PAP phosphatase NrnA [Fusobacterium sp.]|uniref:DHH family phosphoesterase n=2 Tax=Fusobacterium sp. TaxID=68766 RepID=UPI00263A1417|nr:bifunctional oligoribonuclease/PAP phosphatase NrnA [Fusobacterium sp.]
MFLKKLEESKNIVITSHVNPDGDAVGSGLGLFLALRNKYSNKSIRFILEDSIPDNMKFLEGSNLIEKFENVEKDLTPDLFITVDSATFERIGKVGELKKDAFVVNIDHHHLSNPLFGDLNIVRESSSTSEIIFFILRDMLNFPIDKKSAEAIYTGVITDTGNFKYESTTKDTFYVGGELIDLGIDRVKIADEVYKNKSLGAMKALGKSLLEMKIIPEKKLVYFTLTRDFIEKENIKKGETDGIVENLLEYKDCDVSVFLREIEDGKIKGSMRSKKMIDVNEVASIFGGGGHKRAAGFTTSLTEDEIIKKISEKI